MKPEARALSSALSSAHGPQWLLSEESVSAEVHPTAKLSAGIVFHWRAASAGTLHSSVNWADSEHDSHGPQYYLPTAPLAVHYFLAKL